MPGKHLSHDIRKLVISYHERGLKPTAISNKTKVKIPTIKSMLSKWKKYHTITDLKGNSRRRVTTPRVDRLIQKKANSNRFLSARKINVELAQQFGTKISDSTIRNRIRNMGFKGRVAIKKPLLTKPQIKKRLDWAKSHSTWSVSDWKKVLWSDETKINIFGSDGKVFVWRKPGERVKSNCTKKTVKHGGGSIMVWGAMSWKGVGTMEVIEGIMTKEVYQGILDRNLMKSRNSLRLGKNFVFQQDGDPKHTSKLVTNWLQTKRVNVMKWPPQSPDLNPIEHLWSILKKKVAERNPTSRTNLISIVDEEWNNIQKETTAKLVESMPNRVNAVLMAKGGHTNY